jgi:hypothetical protein
MKYRVNVKAVFKGTVIVEAEDGFQAKGIVQKECTLCGNLSVKSSEIFVDYDFTAPATMELGKVKSIVEKSEEQPAST